MTRRGADSSPIFKNSHLRRSKPPGRREIQTILACLITLCLITGTGQAYNQNNTTGTSQDGIQIGTKLYLYTGDGTGTSSSGGSNGGGAHTAVLLWTYTFPAAVTAIDMPTDGSAVVVGTAGGNVTLLNSSGTALWTWRSGAPVTGVGISAGGDAVAAGSGERLAMLDAGGRALWTLEAGSRVLGADISPDGNYCIAGTTAGDVLLTGNRGGLLRKMALESAVTAVAVGSNGTFAAAGTDNGTIRLLNDTGTVLWTYDAGNAVQSVSMTDGGNAVAAGTAGSTVLLLDGGGRGEPVWTGDGQVNAVHLDRHGSMIGAGTGDGHAYLLTDAGIRTWDYGRVRSPEGEDCAVTGIAFSSPADYLAVGSDNGNVYYFAFTSQAPPTVTLEQETATSKPDHSAALFAGMQAAPDSGSGTNPTGDPAPQGAPGFCAAAGLGAVAVAAALRRKGR
ncbi:MAG: hypothetical protein PWR21_709 [Methanoculleus sp.]|nr:hypothetical protein [Methanoculleus sp.]MDK2989014.1 hypothetical protein [Methanoculleus sp.]